MNKNTLPTSQFELPQPQATKPELPRALEGDQDIVKATELKNTELQAAPAPVSPAQAAQSVASADPASASSFIPGLAPVQAIPVDDDMVAEDGELIEKAWVQKAKEIVEHTRDDPHRQNAQINKVKKDYIQKRYQKDVKLNDE